MERSAQTSATTNRTQSGVGDACAGQERVTKLYDRMARFYDLLNAPMERGAGLARRQRVVSRARGPTFVVGVGTGRSLPLYLEGVSLVAADVSHPDARASAAAGRRRATAGPIRRRRCSIVAVPRRDLRHGCRNLCLLLCARPRPRSPGAATSGPSTRSAALPRARAAVEPVLGRLADVATILTVRLVSPALNRRTELNIETAGLRIVEPRADGIWREIVVAPR